MTKKSSKKHIVTESRLVMGVLVALGFGLSMTLGTQSAWAEVTAKLYGASSGSQYLKADGTVATSYAEADAAAASGKYVGCTTEESITNAVTTGADFEIKSGNCNVFGVYGGYSSSEAVSGNQVTINGGTVTCSGEDGGVYGGYTKSGDATNNVVNITGGTVDVDASRGICGGYSKSGNATGNTINISGGTVIGCVYAGCADNTTGEVINNTVNISGTADLTQACLTGFNSNDNNHTGNTLKIAAGWTGSVMGITNFDSIVNNGDLTVTDPDYGMYVYGNSISFQNNGKFKGILKNLEGGTITFTNATGATAEVDCISVIGSGTTTATGLNGITAEKTTEAKGIYSYGTDTSLTNSVSFVTTGGTITATSTNEGASGVYVTGEGTTTVSNLGGITATAGKSAMGIYNYGYEADPKNNVSFVTTGGTITATSTGSNAYGIRAEGTGITSVENLAVITVEGQGNKAVYGIYSNGSDTGFANTVSFVAGSTITATSSVHNAYGISVTGSGTTTIDGSGAITISATAGEGKTAYGIYVGSGSTLNIGTEGGATQPSVTLASGTTSVFKGTTNLFGKLTVAEGAAMNFADGSTLSIDASNSLSEAVINGIDKASQLNITDGTSFVVTNADMWQYYSVVSGDAVTDGSLTAENLWKSVTATDADGNKLCGDYEVKDGKVTVEIRNIPLAVEGNTSALAGVQQGAITMANQIADAVGDNVGLLARPSLADAVYEKTIWANYINSKETVDGMAMWRGSGDNTAKYHGVTVGADFYTSKKAIAGVALTYVTGDVNNYADSTVTNDKTKYYGISLYDRVTNGKSAWTYDIGYSQGKNEITQNSYQTITADAKTNAYTIGAKYEYACNFKHSSLVPFASLRYLRLNSNDYSNSNGHNMSINNQNLIIPKLGLAWTGSFAMPKSDWNFKPLVEVGYIWNLKGREADGTFTSRNRAYDIAYDTVDKSSYYTKLGLNFNRKNFDVGVSYHYSKGDSIRNNKWNVNVSWSF